MHGTTLADGRVVTLALGASSPRKSSLGPVIVALRPLRSLEDVAARVLQAIHVRVSPDVATGGFAWSARTGQALNNLLDDADEGRDHIRRLATKVIRAQDEDERASRESCTTHPQTIAGVVSPVMWRGVLHRCGVCDAARGDRSRRVGALEEVRTLSHTIYPRILEDLGSVPRSIGCTPAPRTSDLETEVIVRGSGGVHPRRGARCIAWRRKPY